MLKVPANADIETAPDFDRQWYRTQSVLQVLLSAVIGAGLAGAFGSGWLSTATVSLGPLQVTYDRLARRTVPIQITVRSDDANAGEDLTLTIGRNLVERAGIIRTNPSAVSTSDATDGVQFNFRAADKGDKEVIISIQPSSFGIFSWVLRAQGFGQIRLFQIIYP